jgi:hypothetical protein
MTGAVLDRPGSRFGFTSAPAGESACAGERGGGTLEDLLNETLRETRTNGSTDCPMCHARMTLARASAECGGCGSKLS